MLSKTMIDPSVGMVLLGGGGHRCTHLLMALGGQNKCCQKEGVTLRVTSHMRLRARDRYTSSTLIDGKHGAGPNSLYTTIPT